MGLASIIISAATKEIAGFTVIGYLTEKAAISVPENLDRIRKRK
mgnify:CR=1 FL=1